MISCKQKKIKLTNASRGKLFETAVNLFQNGTFHEIMKNLSILEDPDRYYNWYHGYTKLQYPFYVEKSNQLRETFNQITYIAGRDDKNQMLFGKLIKQQMYYPFFIQIRPK